MPLIRHRRTQALPPPAYAGFLNVLLVLMAMGVTVYADRERLPAPRLSLSKGENILLRLTPDQKQPWNESGSRGIAYQIKDDGTLKELWRTEGWYSFETYLSNDGHHLVRLGPWHDGHDPQPDHLALAFYRDGQLLRQYMVTDLVKDLTKIRRSVSHYEWRAQEDDAPFGYFEVTPALTWDNKFTLTTCDGLAYTFDATTGAIASTSQVHPDTPGWPKQADIDRLCIAVPLLECPVPYGKLDELLGIPKDAKYSGHYITGNTAVFELLLSDPTSAHGHYALLLSAEAADPVYFHERHLPATVQSLALVYVTAEGHTFTYTPSGAVTHFVASLRKRMHDNQGTPRTLSEEAVKGLNGRLIFNH